MPSAMLAALIVLPAAAGFHAGVAAPRPSLAAHTTALPHAHAHPPRDKHTAACACKRSITTALHANARACALSMRACSLSHAHKQL